MKKIIGLFLILSVLIWYSSLYANQSININAVVGNINHSPIILSINPDSNPRIIRTNKTQSYTIYFSDNEKDEITYTITPKDWYSNPISWTIYSEDYDNNNWAYINFLYLSPSIIPNWNISEIVLTLNDWVNVVTKKLNLYIY